MYSVYIDDTRLPVTPSKLEYKIGSKNETMDLMGLGEINILKGPGLTEISFEALLPAVKYPFAVYDGDFKAPAYYLDLLKKLKNDKKPFKFKVVRITPTGGVVRQTDMEAGLESYSITEDADQGLDVLVSVELKEYKPYKTIIIPLKMINESGTVILEKESQREAKEPAASYSVQAGDTLWAICQKELGDGSRYQEIAALNDIKNPNLIYPGQVLRLE